MIPLQVRMSGWMRYRDEQVADFSEGNLISICGENGAGKSSIFDAITFALYGRHRLGAVGTEDLITQDSDGLDVQFEFELNGRRFKVHRGRSRGLKSDKGSMTSGAATSALYTQDASTQEWMPVAGTNTTAGLQAALNNIVHLSEKAFTSSFLLTQGEATQFLDASPADRFKVISSLIDLSAYEALEKGARDKAREERKRSDDLITDLLPLADVTPDNLDAQRREADDARTAVELAGVNLDKAKRRLEDAKRFHMRTAEIATLQARIAEAQELIARRDQIEEDAHKAEALASILQTLTQMRDQLDAAATLERAADNAAQEAAAIDLGVLQDDIEAGREAIGAAAEALQRAEDALKLAGRVERDADAFRAVANAVVDARNRLQQKRDEQASLETQLGGLDAAREEAESLSAVAHALPELRGLMEVSLKIDALAKADPDVAIKEATAHQKDALPGEAKLAAEVARAEAALHTAQGGAAAAAARLADAQEQLRQRQEAAGEAICSRCGQPVTPEHAATEIAELTERIAGSAALSQALAADGTAARQELETARSALDALQADLRKTEASLVQFQALSTALKTVRADFKERQGSFAKIAPPVLISLTNGKDGAGLRAVLAQHGDVPMRFQKASRRHQELLGVKGQLDAVAREAVAAATGVTEAEARAGVRLEEVECAEATYLEAKTALEAAAGERDGAQAMLVTLETALKQAERGLAGLTEQRNVLLATEASSRLKAQGARDTAAALSQGLPKTLQTPALADCDAVLQGLDADRLALKDAPLERQRLQAAERESAAAAGESRAKEAEIAAIPEEHRVDPNVAEAEAKAATEAQLRAREAEQSATSGLATMEQRARQKENLERQQKASAERGRSFNKLARLMGKSGLQGVLVTTALETITHHANAFLSRLTGASLQMRLERGASNDELALLGIDTTCMREARSVQALSGSQKFRCAVAIAYGIGQYAGAGGMRSIVIDEGFGSLDEVGQEQMVDELKALSQHMDKVIVVSHLPVFSDREHFPVQLRVEKQGNTSRIRNT